MEANQWEVSSGRVTPRYPAPPWCNTTVPSHQVLDLANFAPCLEPCRCNHPKRRFLDAMVSRIPEWCSGIVVKFFNPAPLISASSRLFPMHHLPRGVYRRGGELKPCFIRCSPPPLPFLVVDPLSNLFFTLKKTRLRAKKLPILTYGQKRHAWATFGPR